MQLAPQNQGLVFMNTTRLQAARKRSLAAQTSVLGMSGALAKAEEKPTNGFYLKLTNPNYLNEFSFSQVFLSKKKLFGAVV